MPELRRMIILKIYPTMRNSLIAILLFCGGGSSSEPIPIKTNIDASFGIVRNQVRQEITNELSHFGPDGPLKIIYGFHYGFDSIPTVDSFLSVIDTALLTNKRYTELSKRLEKLLRYFYINEDFIIPNNNYHDSIALFDIYIQTHMLLDSIVKKIGKHKIRDESITTNFSIRMHNSYPKNIDTIPPMDVYKFIKIRYDSAHVKGTLKYNGDVTQSIVKNYFDSSNSIHFNYKPFIKWLTMDLPDKKRGIEKSHIKLEYGNYWFELGFNGTYSDENSSGEPIPPGFYYAIYPIRYLFILDDNIVEDSRNRGMSFFEPF